jgi:hypothetical protein
MHGQMNVKFVTMHGHMNVKFVTMQGHMNVKITDNVASLIFTQFFL